MKKFQKKTHSSSVSSLSKKKTQNQNQNQNQLQADKGSAGVEMNQCNAEISFNKFAYGKSEKGGGLYLQGVGALLTRNFFFETFSESRFFFSLFRLIKTPKLTLSFLSPSISKTPPPPPLQSATSRAASSRTTPPPSAAASSAAPRRATSSTRPSKGTERNPSAEASTTRTFRETWRVASSRATGPRGGRHCSGRSRRGTRGTTRGWMTRRRSLTTLRFDFFERKN